MNLTAETVHDALRQIPTDSPYTQPLSLALSLMKKEPPEELRPHIKEKVQLCLEVISLKKGVVGDGNKE